MSHDFITENIRKLQQCIDQITPDLQNAQESGKQLTLWDDVSTGYVDRLKKLIDSQAALTRAYAQLEQLRLDHERIKTTKDLVHGERRFIVERTIVYRNDPPGI